MLQGIVLHPTLPVIVQVKPQSCPQWSHRNNYSEVTPICNFRLQFLFVISVRQISLCPLSLRSQLSPAQLSLYKAIAPAQFTLLNLHWFKSSKRPKQRYFSRTVNHRSTCISAVRLMPPLMLSWSIAGLASIPQPTAQFVDITTFGRSPIPSLFIMIPPYGSASTDL